MNTPHTFNDGYYCKKDNARLNDKKSNRKEGYCEIFDALVTCDECKYFGKR
jgi:hypothetical protein